MSIVKCHESHYVGVLDNPPIFVTYARAAYSALPQKSSRITFQPTYANFLSLKITQYDKFTKAGNLTKTFSSEKFIETNNVFAIRGKKTLPTSLPEDCAELSSNKYK